MDPSPPDTNPKVFLSQLHTELTRKEHSEFTRRRLMFAVAVLESRAELKKSSRIPLHHQRAVARAIAHGDMAAILAIGDRRGRKEPDESTLKQIAAELKERDGRAPSIRRIAERARREGLRISRDRLALMFPPPRKPEVSARIRGRRFVDLSMLHFAPGLTVLGFVSNKAKCLRALDPANEAEAMLPPTLTSCDRARVLECAQAAAAMQLKFGECLAPCWDDLLDLARQMPKEGRWLFCVACNPKKIPRRVESALQSIAAKTPATICRVSSPDLALRRMLSPRLASLGAGYFPTLGATVRDLAGLGGHRYRSVSLAQLPAVRDKAMKLRVGLEQQLQSLGVHVWVGPIKVKRLLSRSDLSANEAHERPALVAPLPVDFHLITISEESPTDSDLIPLSFEGVEDVLARLPMDKLLARTKRIFELQDKFQEKHANEDMSACASFFSRPNDNFLGMDFFAVLRPLTKVAHEVVTFYGVLLLLCYDPDTLLPPTDIVTGVKRGHFAAAYATFMEEAAAHVEKCLGYLSLADLRKCDPHLDAHELDDMRAAVKLVMLSRLMRVWKSGLDEATRRITMALSKVAQDGCWMSEMNERIEVVLQTMHPPDAVKMLSGMGAPFAGIWPTVTVSRRHLLRSTRTWARWMAKGLARQRLGKEVIPGVSTEALISDWERAAGFSGRREEDKAMPNVAAGLPPESVEELLAERLETAHPPLDKKEVTAWFLRLLTALRRCAEQKQRVRLGGLTGIVPRGIGKLLNSTAEEFKRDGWKDLCGNNPNGKNLHQELEAFFAARAQAAGG